MIPRFRQNEARTDPLLYGHTLTCITYGIDLQRTYSTEKNNFHINTCLHVCLFLSNIGQHPPAIDVNREESEEIDGSVSTSPASSHVGGMYIFFPVYSASQISFDSCAKGISLYKQVTDLNLAMVKCCRNVE